MEAALVLGTIRGERGVAQTRIGQDDLVAQEQHLERVETGEEVLARTRGRRLAHVPTGDVERGQGAVVVEEVAEVGALGGVPRRGLVEGAQYRVVGEEVAEVRHVGSVEDIDAGQGGKPRAIEHVGHGGDPRSISEVAHT